MNARSERYRFPAPPSAVSQLRQVEDLRGPAGGLEAVMNTGAADAPLVAVVCHPYPPAGGTLHNKVVYHAMKALCGLGVPVLRFNFRGVGRSEGSFDHGNGEQDDVRAAVEWAASRLGLPVLLGGFSFGGYVALRGCRSDDRVVGRFALGLPWQSGGRSYEYDFWGECSGPLLVVNGDHDPFMPTRELQRLLSSAPVGTQGELVRGAEHFFQGVPESPESKLPIMQRVLATWVLETLAQSAP